MILRRYFLREALRLALLIVSGLFAVYLSMRFAGYLGDAAEGKVAPQHLSSIIGLKMLVSFKDLLPMSLMIGIFGAAVGLQQHSEWAAMRAAGISHQALLGPTLLLALIFATAVGGISLGLGPGAELKLQELREQTENDATIAGVKSGRFREFSGGSRVFYAETMSPDDKFLEHTFVRSGTMLEPEVMRAERTEITTDRKSRDRFAVFHSGYSWRGMPGQGDFVRVDFERYGVRIENRDPTAFGAHIGFLSTHELLRHQGAAYSTEFHWRLAPALSTLLGAALAFLIGVSGHRRNWYLGLVVLVAGYFTYTNLLGVGRSLLRKEVLPAVIGLWPVHLIFAGLVLMIFLAQRRRLHMRKPAKQQLLLTGPQ